MSLQARSTTTTSCSDGLAAETQAQLDDQLRRRGLFFGERPLCSVLRPRFLTPAQYRFLQERVGLLLTAFDKAYHGRWRTTRLPRSVRALDWEEELIHDDPGFREPSPVSRLDAFFVSERGGLRSPSTTPRRPPAPPTATC
jgi:hypothetical protein